jgi:LPS export ABC transporter protein LptC
MLTPCFFYAGGLLSIMKLRWKFFTLLLSLVFIAMLIGGYLLLRRADMSIPSLLRRPPGARLFMSMQGFRFTQSEGGRVAWRMQAGNADLYDSKEAQLRDLEITFITPDQKEAVLRGDAGTLDTASGNASIRAVDNDVRIVTSDGYLLTTNSLFWTAGQRLVTTPDPFKVLGREIYLEGKGLTGNVDMRRIVVNNNVKAVLQE